MKAKIDALAEISPDRVIEMYESGISKIPRANRQMAYQYLRSYATVYYSPAEVPAEISERINTLEKKWPVPLSTDGSAIN